MQIVFQLLAIGFLLIFSVKLAMYSKGGDSSSADWSEAYIWRVKCSQIAPVRLGVLKSLFLNRKCRTEAFLPEGPFFLGTNVLKNDLILLSSKKVRLYLNVLPEKVLLTVLQGEVHVNGHSFRNNPGKQIVIRDWSQISIEEVQLEFRKVG